MKGFLGAFLVFSLWAVGSIYYLHLKGVTSKNESFQAPIQNDSESDTNTLADFSTVEKKTAEIRKVDVLDTTTIVTDTLIDKEKERINVKGTKPPRKSATPVNAFSNAQLLADEIKKSIAISDTIDIDTNEPEQSLDTKIYIGDRASVSTRIFYPQYNNTDLVLDKEIVAYAGELKQLLKDHPEKKVTIIGHTDNIGNGQDNFKIALRKSRQVKWYLTSRRGIPRRKVTATSRGEEEPIESNNSKWGREQNNRIEVIID